ncbi:uncharacterized protein LOC125141163 [Tachysurus fulvidraco]|uniref:uncharacterized protein LOC125141162 n=1 Tax=Tachysurus fulvidraco TaxID=1234273 RepID=UPI001FEF009E|nr:uncharacterized protein LOC125141162 [Tachysurus fulvidraco]XP_047669195.1 uncharacterized protein LOC125141163 [Tachysurus fulvidraco]
MKILLIFVLCLISGGGSVTDERMSSGEGVFITSGGSVTDERMSSGEGVLTTSGGSVTDERMSSGEGVLTTRFPAFTVITVSVILLLLLIGIIILILTLRKRRIIKASLGMCCVPGSGNIQEVPVVFNEIKDTRQLSETSTVYSNAQLPTIPSDQDTFSTVQLPTHLSTEAEGLTYATISLHSDATSTDDAVPQFKEDVSSENSSVHHISSSV